MIIENDITIEEKIPINTDFRVMNGILRVPSTFIVCSLLKWKK
jgi:hypothetical protein